MTFEVIQFLIVQHCNVITTKYIGKLNKIEELHVSQNTYGCMTFGKGGKIHNEEKKAFQQMKLVKVNSSTQKNEAMLSSFILF